MPRGEIPSFPLWSTHLPCGITPYSPAYTARNNTFHVLHLVLITSQSCCCTEHQALIAKGERDPSRLHIPSQPQSSSSCCGDRSRDPAGKARASFLPWETAPGLTASCSPPKKKQLVFVGLFERKRSQHFHPGSG